MVVNLLFITCKQLISIIFENSCISAFKEKHFLWKFKHQRHKLPETGFLNICVSWHHILVTFFVTFESIRIFSSSKYNEIPNFNPQKSHKRPKQNFSSHYQWRFLGVGILSGSRFKTHFIHFPCAHNKTFYTFQSPHGGSAWCLQKQINKWSRVQSIWNQADK